jgi:hypothetical protein
MSLYVAVLQIIFNVLLFIPSSLSVAAAAVFASSDS